MLLEYGALIILIYACLFGPVIGGLIFMFKRPERWVKVVGVVILVTFIFMLVWTWMEAHP